MSDSGEGSSNVVKNSYMFSLWLKFKSLKRNVAVRRLAVTLQERLFNKIDEESLPRKLNNFIKSTELRWKRSASNLSNFYYQNEVWLQKDFDIPFQTKVSLRGKVGRPSKQFTECSDRGKQLKCKTLVDNTTLEELAFATKMQLNMSGKRLAAEVVEHVTCTTPSKRPKKYKKAYNVICKSPKKSHLKKLSEDEVLSFLMNAKLSKQQYEIIRSTSKAHGANIYPPYKNVTEAKKKCYPPDECVKITETSGEIALQSLLDLTANRICSIQETVLKNLPSNAEQLVLVSKYGCDGSSGQSNYKQRFSEKQVTDSSIFMVALVPLQLKCILPSGNTEAIIWQNPAPSSSRFCRPVKFLFARETNELIKEEVAAIQHQISKLSSTFYGKNVIKHQLMLTMVDGKICNSLTNTPSTYCYICRAKLSDMNNIEKIIQKSSLTDSFSFGISPLHAWIRFMECCLKISYRLDFKKYQARGPLKDLKDSRKMMIIEKLREELGILVDQPKPGYGSTNDGNTARTFFKNPSLTATVTGLNEDLLHRFSTILITLASGFYVDADKFDVYAKQTAALYVKEYGWYQMPPSIHKVLIHGGDIIRDAIVPIGHLGEEAQEAINHEFKFIREHHTRKDSRIHTNQDLIHHLLLYSDPIISLTGRKLRSARKYFSSDVLSLLREPNFSLPTNSSDDSS